MEKIVKEIFEVKSSYVKIFDWKRYIDYYTDLKDCGISNEFDAIYHMIYHGRFNNRKLYDMNGNDFVYIFNSEHYENITKKKFDSEVHAYIDWCNNSNIRLFYKYIDITSIYKSLLIDYDYILRTITKYTNIDVLFVNEKDNVEFINNCDNLYKTKIAAEKKKAEEEKKKAEEARIAAEKKKAEEARIAAEKKKAEEARIAAEKKIYEQKLKFYSLNSDFDSTKTINNLKLSNVYKNIDYFSEFLRPYKNILFICSDYPGYGGAATNCENIANYYKSTHNVYSVYWNWDFSQNKHYHEDEYSTIVDKYNLSDTLKNLKMKPDIIVYKNVCDFNIQTIFNCPTIFLIPGIYTNNLDMNYTELDTIELQSKYINTPTIEQIKKCDYSFCNSIHVKEILKKWYNLDVGLFCSSFVPYYGKMINDDIDFLKRKYNYGLIVSDFTRKIKNVEKSIEFLKGKQDVILIGEGSSKYKQEGFSCIELVDRFQMIQYYKQIKYIVQDGHFEGCSNVMIEGIFNGCKIKQKYHEYNVVVSSTQYPGYGGAATNAYQIIKFLRQNGVNTVGVFFHNRLDVNYDPEDIGGIFLYLTNDYKADNVRNDVKSYLKREPNYCLAKNYRAPYLCKELFNCYTVYLVSGINHFNLFYPTTSALKLMGNSFVIDKNNIIKEEIKTCNLCESIIVNSQLTHNIFTKIYPEYVYKLKPHLDTTFCIKQLDQTFEKEFDIILICSNFERESKNMLFLLDVIKNKKFDNYRKIIIGEKSDLFKNVKNVTLLPLQIHKNAIEYMCKSKILLHPALYESNSNTIREAYYHKCLPMITRNVGYNELFPDYLICNDFKVNEWLNKVKYVLDNYDNVKNTVIDFNTSLDIDKLLV